jgi:hypothetical protein
VGILNFKLNNIHLTQTLFVKVHGHSAHPLHTLNPVS